MNWSHSEKSAEISKEKRLRRRTTFLVFLWKRLVAIQKMQKYPNPVLKKLRQQERRPLRQRSKVTSQVSLDCDILNCVQSGEIEQLDFVWDVNYNGSEKKILHARKKTNGPQISKSTFGVSPFMPTPKYQRNNSVEEVSEGRKIWGMRGVAFFTSD